jgi:hypothetical protein
MTDFGRREAPALGLDSEVFAAGLLQVAGTVEAGTRNRT